MSAVVDVPSALRVTTYGASSTLRGTKKGGGGGSASRSRARSRAGRGVLKENCRSGRARPLAGGCVHAPRDWRVVVERGAHDGERHGASTPPGPDPHTPVRLVRLLRLNRPPDHSLARRREGGDARKILRGCSSPPKKARAGSPPRDAQRLFASGQRPRDGVAPRTTPRDGLARRRVAAGLRARASRPLSFERTQVACLHPSNPGYGLPVVADRMGTSHRIPEIAGGRLVS